MNRFWISHLLAMAAVVVATSTASAFSELVVFGDSLSDIGNIADAPLINTPGPYYNDGRFTNDGPVYAEIVADTLGLGPLSHSKIGGGDYAYGGALTAGTPFPENLFIADVNDQVTTFLGGPAADPNALFILFAGANDLIGDPGDTTTPVNNLVGSLNALIGDGAQEFLVMNLPLLGLTPRFNSSPTFMNNSTITFNSALDTALDTLESGNPAVTIRRLDVANLFSQVVAAPATFGLTNVSDSAAPGLSPGDTSYDTGLIVSDPDSYLFWDDLHPTAAGHELLAEQVLLALQLAGDYNDDGIVDGADYSVWRDQLGQPIALLNETETLGMVTQEDFTAWSNNFGATSSGSGSGAHTAVPEPSGLLLLAVGACFLAPIGQCRQASISMPLL